MSIYNLLQLRESGEIPLGWDFATFDADKFIYYTVTIALPNREYKRNGFNYSNLTSDEQKILLYKLLKRNVKNIRTVCNFIYVFEMHKSGNMHLHGIVRCKRVIHDCIVMIDFVKRILLDIRKLLNSQNKLFKYNDKLFVNNDYGATYKGVPIYCEMVLNKEGYIKWLEYMYKQFAEL